MFKVKFFQLLLCWSCQQRNFVGCAEGNAALPQPGAVGRIDGEHPASSITEDWLWTTGSLSKSQAWCQAGRSQGPWGQVLVTCWARATWATSNACGLGTTFLSGSSGHGPYSSLGHLWRVSPQAFTSFVSWSDFWREEGCHQLLLSRRGSRGISPYRLPTPASHLIAALKVLDVTSLCSHLYSSPSSTWPFSSICLQSLPRSRYERAEALWSCLVCSVLGWIGPCSSTINVFHETLLGSVLMSLNAVLPDVILAAIYQPVQSGIRRKGPDSVPNLAVTFHLFLGLSPALPRPN